ncbi:MAG: carbon starvation protein A [Victivallaceae bacterium]|jgi:carbon starvation protein
MGSLVLIVVALCVFTLGYRFYGLFIAHKVLGIDPKRPTPAVEFADGRDFVATNKYMLFGHHFAAIAAAGPLLGPILAAQFGYLPGALWIIIGSVIGGGVHDMTVLFASVRHGGRSLGEIAREQIGPAGGVAATLAVLSILILALAGLALAVVNAMAESAWGTFTVFASIPIALIMGLYMQYFKPGDVKGGSIIGVTLLLASVFFGHYIASVPALAQIFLLSKNQIAIAIPLYGFAASVLPVWMILCPRDYLSSYLKIGTIGLLAVGILVVLPELKMAPVMKFSSGGGPVIPGSLFPFLFITIACGAISGFHSIIGTGTSSKMIATEADIPFVGYGAMLMEGMVALMALISACVLVPADYFAINAAPEAFAKLGMSTVNLNALSAGVQENLQGRTGGGVSLAVGMAYIFSSLPYMDKLMSYWYHYAIMFEALFVLTAVDAGTRAGRFLLQELFGKFDRRFLNPRWTPGIVVTGAVFTFSWGYLVYTGNIATIWPLLGMSNQLLAACALFIVSVMLLAMGKKKYVWITAAPAFFLVIVTFCAGYLNITQNYLPKGKYLLVTLSILVMCLMAVVFVIAFKRALKHYYDTGRPEDLAPEAPPEEPEEVPLYEEARHAESEPRI